MSITISGESVTVPANGLRHHVLRYGLPDAPDLLLLPGITSPAPTADFLAAHLAGCGYRVHVPDLRGRGRTDRARAGRYRLIDYADDIAGLVEELDLRDPAILGHSMGARIAAAYSVRHGSAQHAPIVLVDPPVSGPGRDPYPTTRQQFLDQLREAQRGTSAEEVRRFYPGWPGRELQLRAEVLASCDETAVLESHSGFESEDFFPLWREVSNPALLVRGELSPVVPDSAVEELRAANAAVDIATVAGAGHMVFWDNLAGFFAAADDVLRLRPER